MKTKIMQLSDHIQDNYARRVRSILNECINSLYDQTVKDGNSCKLYADDYQNVINCQKYLCQLGVLVNRSFPCKRGSLKNGRNT